MVISAMDKQGEKILFLIKYFGKASVKSYLLSKDLKEVRALAIISLCLGKEHHAMQQEQQVGKVGGMFKE